jgi:hypothetical protein
MSLQLWPSADEQHFLVHAVTMYCTSFMGPYNIMGTYTIEDFWLEVYNVWYDLFLVPSTDALEEQERLVSAFVPLSMTIPNGNSENQELDSVEGE